VVSIEQINKKESISHQNFKSSVSKICGGGGGGGGEVVGIYARLSSDFVDRTIV